jgi:hypothetical protein
MFGNKIFRGVPLSTVGRFIGEIWIRSTPNETDRYILNRTSAAKYRLVAAASRAVTPPPPPPLILICSHFLEKPPPPTISPPPSLL